MDEGCVSSDHVYLSSQPGPLCSSCLSPPVAPGLLRSVRPLDRARIAGYTRLGMGFDRLMRMWDV